MPSNKPRLYIGLHLRGGPKTPDRANSYHWSLILLPKHLTPATTGMRYHCKNDFTNTWEYESAPTGVLSSEQLLARVQIGKVANVGRMEEVFKNIPVRQGDAGFNCVSWVRAAVGEGLLGREPERVCEWEWAREVSLEYVAPKKEEGRWKGRGGFEVGVVPTWDMREGKEVVA